MECGSCGSPAIYLCACVKARLCDGCFVLHCENYPENEHQLIPIEECEGSYTVEELKSAPELVKSRVNEEIERLEGYKTTVLGLISAICEAKYEGELGEIAEKLVKNHEEQRKALETALDTLNQTRLIDKLPTEGFPWANIHMPLQESFLSAHSSYGKLTVSIETAIKTNIKWNLPEKPLQMRGKAQILPAPNTLTPLPEPSVEEEKLDLPSDPALKMQLLQENAALRTAYFRKMRLNPTWKLRQSFLSNGQLRDASTVIAKGVDKADISDLFLVLFSHSTSVNTLILTGCSFKMADFAQLCEIISTLPLISLTLERCKLAISHILKLQPQLPPSLQSLTLSSNYFPPSVLSLAHLKGLISLDIRNLPRDSGLVLQSGVNVMKD